MEVPPRFELGNKGLYDLRPLSLTVRDYSIYAGSVSNAIFKKIQHVTKNATRNATKCCNFNLILMFVRPDKICIYDALDNKKMQQQMTKSDAKNCCILCCILGVFYAPFTCKSNNGELRLYRAYIVL